MPRQFGKRDSSVSWDACGECNRKHDPGAQCRPDNTWLARGIPSTDPGIVWLKRPMPDGGWPVDQSLPRDDSFSWWIRSTCGHQGGARQWAFYREADADTYEQLFREDACRYSRCPEWMMRHRHG